MGHFVKLAILQILKMSFYFGTDQQQSISDQTGPFIVVTVQTKHMLDEGAKKLRFDDLEY